jgi:RimJ/RimL family protein N-acetyltransferase
MTDFIELSEQLQRVFSTRLALRPLALADGWPLFEATRNPEFNKNLLWPQPQNPLVVLDRVETIMDAARRGALTALSAVLKQTGEWVSLYRFQPYEADQSLVEMGLWVHEKFWRDRYGLELTQACVDSAFSLSDISLLIGCTSVDNPAAGRILERAGLHATQVVFRQSETKVERPSQEFQITRAQWMARRSQGTFQCVPEPSTIPLLSPDSTVLTEPIGAEFSRRPAANLGLSPDSRDDLRAMA